MKPTLLIVDDCHQMSSFLKHIFQANYHIAVMHDSQSALESISTGFKPDAMIIDYNLGDECGINLLKQLPSEIPSLMLTSEQKSEVRIKCLEAGAKDYLAKPFHPTELKLRLERIM